MRHRQVFLLKSFEKSLFCYLKAHNNFSLGVPAEVTSMAIRNSLKSIVPDLSASKVLKTFWQNFSASPDGKNILYISMNVPGVSFPLGQSCKNPAYHSLINELIINQRKRSAAFVWEKSRRFVSNQKKSMKLLIINPDGFFIITRVFLQELYVILC